MLCMLSASRRCSILHNKTTLEAAEKIECLRYLENGVPLKMVVTGHGGKCDTPEDLETSRQTPAVIEFLKAVYWSAGWFLQYHLAELFQPAIGKIILIHTLPVVSQVLCFST